MTEKQNGLDRRELLKTGLAATAGAAVAGSVFARSAAAEQRPASSTSALPTRVLGSTGVELPILAFGGVALTSNWTRTPFAQRVELARAAYERGIRYFDTAVEYRESEKVLGEALKDVRHHVYLNTKVDVVKPEDVRRTVERSMGDLRTDVIDCVQIHGTPGIEAMTVPGAMAVRDALAKLRDEGMIRFVGLTGHNYFHKLHALISSGGFDTVMMAYGYFRKGMWRLLSNDMVELRELCLAKAHELGMGILAMKVMGGAVLTPPRSARLAPDSDPESLKALPAAAIRWVRQDPRIHLLCIGQASPGEIDANIRTLVDDRPFSEEDRLLLASFSAKAYPNYAQAIADRA